MTSGDTISRYRILGPLGHGGGGVVYRAEDTVLNRPVALKFLPPDSLSGTDQKRLFNEARAAAQVRHPNICPIYDIEEANGQVFIAMECLEGETLARKIARGPLPIATAFEIAIQIAAGLEKAHSAGVVHRDIKSSNIIVSPDGHISILDFGLALYSGAARLTADGSTVGTPAYMSPEQAEGREVDHRTDIWSMGVVVYEMLTGALPFGAQGGAPMFRAIVEADPPAMSSLRPGIPAVLESVVKNALAKRPEDRWQSVRRISDELRRGSRTSSGDATTIAIAPRRRSRRRAMIWGAAVLVAAFGAIPVVNWFDRTGQSAGPMQVAVLPFEVVGGVEAARVTSDGLVEILTTALSELEQFQGRIMTVPASEIRRRGIASAQDARRVYGVGMAITGSAQALGDKLQITANLVDAVKLRQIRAKSFEYDPADPLASRNGAIEQVARLLELQLTSTQRQAITAGDTTAGDAYAAYLHGKGFLARYDQKGNLGKAIASFETATRHDPKYALAYAGLGEAYWRQSRALGDARAAVLAVENAERAVQLGDSIASVHAVLGAIYGTSAREDDAIRELRTALRLQPAHAEAQRELARVYANLGRFAEAEASYVQATKSRPTDWYSYLLLGIFYYQLERYPEAEAAFVRARGLTPDNAIVSRNLGALYVNQGRYDAAIKVFRSSLRSESNARMFGALGSAYYYQHRFREAVAAVETAAELEPNRYHFWGNLGNYYKWMPGGSGKMEPALRKAVSLVEKQLEVTPNDYDARANLAEYRARLGDRAGTLAEIARIPEPARKPRAARLAIAYELTGHRAEAIAVVESNMKTAASLNQIKNDPDLTKLWADPALRKAAGAPQR